MRDSILRLTLGLAMVLIACGDDDGDAQDAGDIEDAGRAGSGGRAGAGAGGSTGGAGSCPEPRKDDLEAWCDDAATTCELSFEGRRARVCGELQCSRPACGVSESANTCGGRTLSYFRGFDIQSARYHYDRHGELVGVDEPLQPNGCMASRHVYGMDCESLDSSAVDCAKIEADSGVEDAGR